MKFLFNLCGVIELCLLVMAGGKVEVAIVKVVKPRGPSVLGWFCLFVCWDDIDSVVCDITVVFVAFCD